MREIQEAVTELTLDRLVKKLSFLNRIIPHWEYRDRFLYYTLRAYKEYYELEMGDLLNEMENK